MQDIVTSTGLIQMRRHVVLGHARVVAQRMGCTPLDVDRAEVAAAVALDSGHTAHRAIVAAAELSAALMLMREAVELGRQPRSVRKVTRKATRDVSARYAVIAAVLGMAIIIGARLLGVGA